MNKTRYIWLGIFTILFLWIYFIFISPRIFNASTSIVPDVLGLTEKEAVKKLKEDKISYQITYMQNSSEVTLKTIPSAGMKIKKKHLVEVYIGKVFPYTYHTLVGQKYDEIVDELEQLKVDCGIEVELVYELNDNVISGLILKESITDGSVLEKGQKITLTISKNENYFLMPNLVGMNVIEAIECLKKYEIKFQIVYYTAPIEKDIVLFQSFPKDSIVKKGNPYEMDLYVSKGMDVPLSTINPYELEELLVFLGFDVDLFFVNSNIETDKLVAFEVQKLYDSNVMKYILWITK